MTAQQKLAPSPVNGSVAEGGRPADPDSLPKEKYGKFVDTEELPKLYVSSILNLSGGSQEGFL